MTNCLVEKMAENQETPSQRVRRLLGVSGVDPDDPDYSVYVAEMTALIEKLKPDDKSAIDLFKLTVRPCLDEHDRTFLKFISEMMKYNGFNPRRMISILMEKHARTEAAIKKYPESLVYNEMNTSGELSSEGEPPLMSLLVRASNNISFTDDINFLCLIFIGGKFNQKYFDFLKRQMALLKVKYNINTAKRRPGQTLDAEIMTLSRIAASFPGTTVGLFYKGFGRSVVDPTILFPDHNLPRALFSPMIASTIPVHPDAPKAIMMAIAVATDDILHQNAKRGLRNLYNYFLASYNSEAMPQKSRIIYCKKWNIVTYPDENTDAFKYTDDVKAAREKAKALISVSRTNDPYLQTLMTLI